MIRRFDPATRTLEPVEALPGAGWVHVEDPTAAELETVARRLHVGRAFLDHALDVDEVARIDHDPGGAVLVVVRVPHAEGDDSPIPYRAVAVGVLAVDGLVLTVSRATTRVFDDLLRRGDLEARPARLVLELLLVSAARFLSDLAAIDRTVDTIERRLKESLRNEAVLDLLRYQKGLVFFETALGSNELMLERLRKDTRLPITDADHELLDDVLVEIRQAIQMVTISSGILSQMMDAFASIISNNLNAVMKVLTSLTIILALPTMVASFYGMNVVLPGQHHPAAFFGTIGASVLVAIGVAVLFWRRRWL